MIAGLARIRLAARLPKMTAHSPGRRRFLGGAGAWLGASLAGLRADRENFHTVSIIHTTDLHGHIVPTRTYEGVENVGGLARCATRIRQWRREAPDSLLVDVGDVWQGTAESYLEKGRLMMRLFNLLEYDAWTLGNHDFDWGRGALEANLALSRPAVLTGNLRVDGKSPGALDGAWKSVLPWVMRESGGFRIALIGLVTPGLPYWLPPELLGGAEALDPLESLRRSVAEARAAKADAIVVTGHMGFINQDDFANPVRAVLTQVPGVDVYLGGHTHRNQPLWKIGDVICSQAGYYGTHCGRVDLTFDRDTRKLIGRDAMTDLMDARFEPDAAVMDLAAPDLKTSAEQLARKVAVVKTPVKSGGADNPLAILFCECFAEALAHNGSPVDGVLHGTFRSGDVPAGEVTVADCWKMLPYENLLVTAELGARELMEIIKMERGIRTSDRILWPFQLRLDGGGAVRSFTHRGKPVDMDARFTIAFNSYDAQSGGQSMMLLWEMLARPEAKRRFTGIETRNALINGLLRRREI